VTVLSGLIIATLASFFQGHLWWLDLFAHFRWQYILASLLVLIFSFNNRRQLYLASFILIGNLWGVSHSGFAMTENKGPIDDTSLSLSVVSLNTYVFNTDYQDITSFIKTTRADIVVLSELRADWKQSLSPLLELYPFHHQVTGHALGDEMSSMLAILSRFPLTNPHSSVNPVRRNAYLLAADVEHPVGVFTVAGVHLSNSVTPFKATNQKDEVNNLIDWVHTQPRLAFVAGDFNLTPFSNQYQKLLAESGLTQSKQNYFPTWPSPLMPVGIPIDHVLIGPRAQIVEMTVGPAVGSDHRPIIAKISLNQSP